MKRFDKKAALALSVQAIVILVIAFVVLGLALTLTRFIFKTAQEKAGGAIDIIELESKPTSDNPITVPARVTISRKDSVPLDIGVYNTAEGNYDNATLAIKQCTSASTGLPVNETPSLVTIAQTVGQSDSKAFRAYLTENGLATGNYICILKVYNLQSSLEYDTKQFYMIVTS
ncbi:hypothetical protein KY343_06435 [Candidatus Woesearchaeota archaeon]|nr:hypothetical protein [Candidatus Woesearchaeota archaeon]